MVGAGLKVGTVVVWSEATTGDGELFEEYPKGLAISEQTVYAVADLDTEHWVVDMGAINARLHFGEGTVVALGDTHAWVKINFQESDDDGVVSWVSPKVAQLALPDGYGYARLRYHLLRPKT
ncbi:hypothetical protein ACSDR0_16235 [Streptosporangium sp. G11]|uniref:hypothetical protein n=1 Tax=Streptosporangium sp. G11 TaxID=3436926 RepID=UPI003EB801E0